MSNNARDEMQHNYHAVFESIPEFWEKTVQHVDSGKAKALLESLEESWTGKGAETWEALQSTVNRGWSAGARRIEAMQLEIVDYIDTLGLAGLDPVEEHDVAGAYVDIGAFCDGDPESMVSWEEKVQPRSRVARIHVNALFSCANDSAVAMRRGCAIASVIDALEQHGIRCEVWAEFWYKPWGSWDQNTNPPNNKDSNVHRTAVLVKEAGQNMPLDSLAFAVGHPGFFRGLWRGFVDGAGIGFDGWPVNVPDWAVGENDLLFNGLDDNRNAFVDDAAALDTVLKTVEEYMKRVAPDLIH